MELVLDEFRVMGGTGAREGRTLDGLEDALRLGARVAWRWLCEAGASLDRRELSRVGEAVFGYLDELAAACARGYAEAGEQATGDRQRRLLELILADPPPRPEQVAALARTANWILPAPGPAAGGRWSGPASSRAVTGRSAATSTCLPCWSWPTRTWPPR